MLTIEEQDILSRYPPRTRAKRLPYGYLPESEGSSNLLPVSSVILPLNSALDQLDSGIPVRQVTDWLNANTPEGTEISHSGLAKLWRFYRNPKQKAKPKRILSPEEKVAKAKRIKIAAEKRRLINARKRITRLEDEVLSAEELQEREEAKKKLNLAISDEEIPVDREIVFQPHPGPQTAFFAASEQEVLYGGAAGGGKSYALLADPLRYVGNPNFNGLILRRTNDELRELIWKSQLLYPKIDPKAVWREKDKEWRFSAGGRLWMTYLERDEDVQRYQGQAFTYIGFDELTQYPTPFPYEYMRSRLRSTDPTLPLFIRATSNPGGPGHGWVKRMFIDPAPPGVSFDARDSDGNPLVYPKGHAKEGQPLFQRKFIPARLRDNPSLFQDGVYETNLLSLPEQQRRQLLEGDWSVADGAAFSEFRVSDHVVEPFEIPRSWRRFRSCDFGYSARQASAVHWYTVNPVNEQLIVYRELYVTQKTGRELARKILQIESDAEETMAYGVLDSSVWSVRGQSGPSIADEMINEGCRWKPSDRSAGSRIAGKNRIHELLRPDTWTGQPGIVFFNTCRQIIADLPVIPQDKDSDDIDPKYATDHAYDSLRYGVMSRPRSGFTDPYSTQHRVYRPADSVFGY